MHVDASRPWMTALEMQFVALRNCRESIRQPELKGVLGIADRDAVALLPKCQAFAWSADTTKAVWLASKTIPSDTKITRSMLDAVGQGPYWWFFDWPLPIPMRKASTNADEIDSQHIVALLINISPAGLDVTDFRLSPYGPTISSFCVPPFDIALSALMSGTAYDLEDGTVGQSTPRSISVVKFILAACAWLAQRIIATSSGHVERHRRKQLSRESSATPPHDVKVVQLRRQESQQSPRAENDSNEWSCRWIVDGHWRNQVYANNEHKLIYIMPYVKGPDDKPLKVPSHTVYSVSR